ncbi:Tn3 family transposase, partial [Oleiphilus sp. HI0128]
HLLQSCLVYVNTLMIEDVLSDNAIRSKLIPEDYRALSPLIYSHINPYGLFTLDMSDRIAFAA